MREDRPAPAPTKARKVVFSDPFIFHPLRSWIEPVDDPFVAQVESVVADPEWAGKLAEACAAVPRAVAPLRHLVDHAVPLLRLQVRLVV